MPFVQCEPCGRQVIIDPSGTCPEGHRTGVVSARAGLGTGRVAASLGHRLSDPDPDEPEPWIGSIEIDELSLVGASAAVDTPRQIRPLAAPKMHDAPAPALTAEIDDVDRDSLLRELQALSGDLGAFGGDERATRPKTPPAANGATPASNGATPASNGATPAAHTPPGVPAPVPTLRAVPDLDERRAAAAELASLESALADLNGAPRAASSPAATSPAASDLDGLDGLAGLAELDGLAELAELSARRAPSSAPHAPPTPPATRSATARPVAVATPSVPPPPAPPPPVASVAPALTAVLEDEPSAPPPPVLGSFTAHGRKKRRFGR